MAKKDKKENKILFNFSSQPKMMILCFNKIKTTKYNFKIVVKYNSKQVKIHKIKIENYLLEKLCLKMKIQNLHIKRVKIK